MTLYVEGDKVKTLDAENGIIYGTVTEASGDFVRIEADALKRSQISKIQLHVNDIDFVDPSGADDLIHEDMRGLNLTRKVLSERMIQYDTCMILKSIADYNDHDTLAHILGNGFKGYNAMDKETLIAEWNDSEDGWYGAYEDGTLPWKSHEDDPINTLEEDETGEVAHASRKATK
tara:strand:- start:831 stop:1355 length:525 start_codon:yes stop_codon:yes gene_type:complete